MKKILTIVAPLLFALLFSTAIEAQFATTIIKMDTVQIKPALSFKIGVNKLNNKLMYWNKVSWVYIPTVMHDTATLDFASSGATTVSDLTKAMPGAALGMTVAVGAPHGSVTATGTYFGWVSAANVVTIRFSPKATENPASGVFDISVFKY